MSFQLIRLFVVHLCKEYLNALQSVSTWSAESEKKECQLLTQHWQKTGQDQQTSAVVRHQLWFGARPLRLSFSPNYKFRSQFILIGRAGPATNSLYFANADR